MSAPRRATCRGAQGRRCARHYERLRRAAAVQDPGHAGGIALIRAGGLAAWVDSLVPEPPGPEGGAARPAPRSEALDVLVGMLRPHWKE